MHSLEYYENYRSMFQQTFGGLTSIMYTGIAAGIILILLASFFILKKSKHRFWSKWPMFMTGVALFVIGVSAFFWRPGMTHKATVNYDYYHAAIQQDVDIARLKQISVPHDDSVMKHANNTYEDNYHTKHSLYRKIAKQHAKRVFVHAWREKHESRSIESERDSLGIAPLDKLYRSRGHGGAIKLPRWQWYDNMLPISFRK